MVISLPAQTRSKSVKKTSNKKVVTTSKPVTNAVPASAEISSRPVESNSNYDYVKTLNHLNEKKAKEFADKLVAYTSGKYIFLHVKYNTSTQYALRYISATVKDKEKYINQPCKECMDIRFKKRGQVYTFDGVWGNFPDLFPAWKDIFVPTAKTTDYETSDQMVMAEWKHSIGSVQVAFGRLGTAWYLVMK